MFQNVVDFIHEHFVIIPHAFTVWFKMNSNKENQRACAVLAYAIRMKYTFEQTKALFSEHDHFAIAIPKSRKDRNIYQINAIYYRLIREWNDRTIRICDYPELIDVPKWVLEVK